MKLKIEDCGKTAVLQKEYYSLRMSLNLNIFTGTNFDQVHVRKRDREATNGLDALYCMSTCKNDICMRLYIVEHLLFQRKRFQINLFHLKLSCSSLYMLHTIQK